MFRSTTIIRELTLSLAKVTFIKSVKVRRYGLYGGVAAVLQECNFSKDQRRLPDMVRMDRNM
jgi:hypothetical protein